MAGPVGNDLAHAWLLAHGQDLRTWGSGHTRACGLLQECITEHEAERTALHDALSWAVSTLAYMQPGIESDSFKKARAVLAQMDEAHGR